MFTVALASFAMAQNNTGNNLGLRIGGGYGFGAEISGQFGTTANTRVEVDLGWTNHFTSLSGIFQWKGNITGPLGWYAGPGANIGFWSGSPAGHSYSGIGIGIVGQAGLELTPNIPLQFTLDWRPGFYFIGYDKPFFNWNGVYLGIRWRF